MLAVSYAAGEILSFLNSSVKRTDIDPRVADFYDAGKYARTIAYQADKAKFSRIVSTFGFVLNASFLVFGLFGRLDGLLVPLAANTHLRALVFFIIIFLGSDILSIPFELYATFVLEAKYGFNKTTPSLFIADKLKGYLLTLVLGGAVLFAFIFLVEAMGSLFWIAFAALAVALVFFVNMFYTSLMLPLFNKLSELSEGELKDAVNAYASAQGLKLQGIYVMDGSKRSSKANAFFSGLGPKKKIVLFDTLIKNHPVRELVAILAHEAGHLKLAHIAKGFVFSAIQITATAWIFSLFIGNATLSAALGGASYALHLNLIAFGILFAPIASATGLLAMIASRAHEYEADAFAAKTSDASTMVTALKRLSADNLANLYPHPLYVFFNYSHPPLLSRMEHLENAT